MKSIAAVLRTMLPPSHGDGGLDGWRARDEMMERAQLAEERAEARRLAEERAAEQNRAEKESQLREAAARFGFAEYVPAGGESVEVLEARRKTIWRKAFRQYPYLANPQAKARLLAYWSERHARWQAEEERKGRELAGEVDEPAEAEPSYF